VSKATLTGEGESVASDTSHILQFNCKFYEKVKMPTKRSTGLKPSGQLSAVFYILANNFTSRYVKAGAYHPKRGEKT
jgi:hypothetical protein